jgi:tripartite-type tricarboxylate transporter receptor subunit TctC
MAVQLVRMRIGDAAKLCATNGVCYAQSARRRACARGGELDRKRCEEQLTQAAAEGGNLMLFRGRIVLALGAWVGLVASAAAFPDRPVQVVAPWAAGGGVDTVARIFAEGFEKELGVPVAVFNRTGGGGLTGHSFIATAPPDGYILGVASPEIAFYKPLGLGDFTPQNLDLFSRLSLIPAGVTVRADSPYKTLADFLKAVKESPKGTFMGSGTGTGGSWHIAAGGLLKAAGIEPDRLR